MIDPSEGPAAKPSPSATHYVVDIEAYARLVRSLRRTTGARSLSALDDALTRVYRGPDQADRSATGKTLARDLVRDGLRSYHRRRAHEELGPVERAVDETSLASWPMEVDEAVRVIRSAAERIPGRLRVALALRLRGLVDEAATREQLGVDPRRARQLAAEAQRALQNDPDVVRAYRTLIESLGAERHEAIERLVEDVFLGVVDVSPTAS